MIYLTGKDYAKFKKEYKNSIEEITIVKIDEYGKFDVVCDLCEDGRIWLDTTYQCNVQPVGECCGGCGHYARCEVRNGQGKLTLNYEEL